MKNLVFYISILSCFSCGKNKENIVSQDNESLVAPYDTIAKDSFSDGATSVDVARQILISSQSYQDSLKEEAKRIEAEKLAKKELEDKEKVEKKLEEEKKKQKETKTTKKEVEKEATVSTETTSNP